MLDRIFYAVIAVPGRLAARADRLQRRYECRREGGHVWRRQRGGRCMACGARPVAEAARRWWSLEDALRWGRLTTPPGSAAARRTVLEAMGLAPRPDDRRQP